MKFRTFALTALSLTLLVSFVAGDDPQQADKKPAPEPATLEGTLRVHPKFLYKYYIDGFGDGQKCALRSDERFADIKPGTRIRVRGALMSKFHRGRTPTNPSPFPRTWYIEMNVEAVTVLKPASDVPKTAP